jgi:hypothetical protein
MKRAFPWLGVATALVLSGPVGSFAGSGVSYPKPGDPQFTPMLNSITDRIATAKSALNACVHSFIDKNAKAESDRDTLAHNSCLACVRQDRAFSDAENEFFRFQNGWNPSFTGDNTKDTVPFKPGICAEGLIYASTVITDLKAKEQAAQEPILQSAMKSKLVPALECNEKYSKLFALTTSETPENIAVSAFAKCEPLFNEAAEARVNPIYQSGARTERITELIEMFRQASQKRTIGIVVESRAIQKLEPVAPNSNSQPPERKDTGI